MKARSLAMVLALLTILALPMAHADADANSDSEYSIQGKTYVIGNNGPEPLGDIKVTLNISGKIERTNSVWSDSEGKFVFTLPTMIPEECYVTLLFSYSGYSVFGAPACMTSIGGEEFSIDYESILTDKVYNITPSDDARHYILLGSAETPVFITVTGANNKLQRASVTMTNLDSGDSYLGGTDTQGSVEFMKVQIGTYSVDVECNGFKDYSTIIEITRNSSNNFTLELTENGSSTIFGMVSYHFMMFIGVVLGLIFVLTGYLLCIKAWRPKLDSEDLQE